jgi:glycosyltransferase involved in cell wall biosynthesis
MSKYKDLTLIQITDHSLADIGGSLTLFLGMSNIYGPIVGHQLLFFTSMPKNTKKVTYNTSIPNTKNFQIRALHNLYKIRFLGIPTFLFLYSFDLIRILRELSLENKKMIVFVHGVLLSAFILFWRKIFRYKMPVLVIDASSSQFKTSISASISNIISLLAFSILKCDKYIFGETMINVKSFTKIVSLLRINYGTYYIGTDIDYFTPIEKANDQFIIIFPHRLEDYKRPDIAINIFQQFIKNNYGKDIKLFLIGGGSEYNKLKKYVLEQKLDEKIVFFNNIDHTQMKSFYNLSDVFIGTSLKSNYGLSIQEAMSCAKPVVIFKGDYNNSDSQLVEHGIDGFIIKNGDVSEFVNHLQFLYDNPVLRKKIGLNARNKIIKKRNLKDKVKKDLDLLAELSQRY